MKFFFGIMVLKKAISMRIRIGGVFWNFSREGGGGLSAYWCPKPPLKTLDFMDTGPLPLNKPLIRMKAHSPESFWSKFGIRPIVRFMAGVSYPFSNLHPAFRIIILLLLRSQTVHTSDKTGQVIHLVRRIIHLLYVSLGSF